MSMRMGTAASLDMARSGDYLVAPPFFLENWRGLSPYRDFVTNKKVPKLQNKEKQRGADESHGRLEHV